MEQAEYLQEEAKEKGIMDLKDLQTVKEYRKEHGNGIEVIFNVWKDEDYEIYRELLG